MAPTLTLATQEQFLSAFDAFGYADRRVRGGDFSFEAVSAEIKATNRLYGHCVECGMPLDEIDLSGWAAIKAASILTSGVEA